MRIPDRIDHLLFDGTLILANKLQFVADKSLAGLSTKQWLLLRTIRDMQTGPPPMIAQIAAAIDSTHQNAAKMLYKLKRDGLIVVEEGNSDRRSRCVQVTEAGIRHIEQVAADAEGFMKRLFSGIQHEEMDIAGKVLIKTMLNLIDIQEE